MLRFADVREGVEVLTRRDAYIQELSPFDRQVREVCATYREAPNRLTDEGIHTVCIDEKTSIQALEPAATTRLCTP